MDKTKLISVSFNSNMISDWLSKTGSTPLFEQIKEHELAKAKSSFEDWFAAQGFESVYIAYHCGEDCPRLEFNGVAGEFIEECSEWVNRCPKIGLAYDWYPRCQAEEVTPSHIFARFAQASLEEMHRATDELSLESSEPYINSLAEQLINVFLANFNVWHNAYDLAFNEFNKHWLFDYAVGFRDFRGSLKEEYSFLDKYYVDHNTLLVYQEDVEGPICDTPLDINLSSWVF